MDGERLCSWNSNFFIILIIFYFKKNNILRGFSQNHLNPQKFLSFFFVVDIIIILYFRKKILISYRSSLILWDRMFFNILNCIGVYSIYVSNHIIVLLLILYVHFGVKMLLTFVVFFFIFFFLFPFNSIITSVASLMLLYTRY